MIAPDGFGKIFVNFTKDSYVANINFQGNFLFQANVKEDD